MTLRKTIGEFELTDFDSASIWSSDIAGCDEEAVESRAELVVVPENVHGLWVRFHGSLADGTPVAGIAMAECPPPELLLHSFFVEGQWHSLHFPSAPDFVLHHDGPQRLAERLQRTLAETFPIRIETDVLASTNMQAIRQVIGVNGPVT